MLCIAVVLPGYAADFQLEVTSTGYRINGGSVVTLSNSTQVTTFTDGEITVTFGKKSGIAPQFLTSSNGRIRVYNGSTITIKRKSGNLSSATVTSDKTLKNVATGSNGSITGDKWQNGSASEVVLSFNTQTNITKVLVEYDATPVTGKTDPKLYWTDYTYTSGKPTKITSLTKDKSESPVNLYVVSEIVSFTNITPLTYTSSTPSVASVDASTGEVTLVSAGETDIYAIYPGNDTYNAQTISYHLTVTDEQPVALEAPVIAPPPGTYKTGQKITFTCATPEAKIYLTVEDENGAIVKEIKDAVSGATYTFDAEGTYTVEAFSYLGTVDDPDDMSDTVSEIYVIEKPVCATPVFSPAAGTYSVGQTITISSSTPGAKITYYVGDDSFEDVASPASYTFTAEGTYDIVAAATADGYLESATASARYIITTPTCATPTFTFTPGEYDKNNKVTVASATTGAKLNVTVAVEGGETLTFEGVDTPWTYTFPGAGVYTLTAKAVKDGYNDSAEGTFTRTITVRGQVAPVITFSVPEGNVAGETAQVQIEINKDMEEAWPEPQVWYTIDARRAHAYEDGNEDHRIAYTPGQVITIKPDLADGNINQVTINAHAVNAAGHHTHSATYTFGAKNEPGESSYKLVTNAADLKAGDKVILVSNYTYKNQAYGRIPVNVAGVSGTGKSRATEDITITNNEISAADVNKIEKVLTFTLENSGSYFKLKSDAGYLNGNSSNGIYVTASPTSGYYSDVTISIASTGKAAMRFYNGSTAKNHIYFRYFSVSGKTVPALTSYTSAHSEADYDRPMIYRLEETQGEVINPAADYYLVMHRNVWNDGKEVAVPFKYDEAASTDSKAVYTLAVSDIEGGSCVDAAGNDSNPSKAPGFSGDFYVRDGKADHAGVHFAPKAQASVRTLAAAAAPGVEFIPNAEGRAEVALSMVDNSASPVQPGADINAAPVMLTTNNDVAHAITKGTLTLTVDGENSLLEIGQGGITGVEDIIADIEANADVEYYNLQGVRVDAANLAPGIYIRRQGQSATKVYLR